MSLTTGARLGPYEILEPIGAGGMGEVYKARDTRLDRIVAIKISTERFTERFEREARLISSLNHPRICTVHDVGPNYLVLEFVPGDTLADRIARGPIPIAEALPLAREIVEAIEAAHQSGVIHRDLKPANIKFTAEGDVKVLDFGLAKVAESAVAASNPAASPTLTLEATRAGMILGTAAYMPPEQARGAVVDKRADIWAFGCTLFEMLTGRRVFAGESTTDVLAAVVRAEPDWSALPFDTPAPVRRLLRRCLEKDRKRRLPDIGVARLDIDDALLAPDSSAPAGLTTPGRRIAWIVSAVALIAGIAGGALWEFSLIPRPTTWSATALAPSLNASSARLSPDGQLLAFLSFVNELQQVGVMKSDGSSWTILTSDRENGYVSSVAWAPDGSRIFFDRYWGGPHGIYSIPPLGGEPRQLIEDAFAPGPLADGTFLGVKNTSRGDMQLFRFFPETGKADPLPIFMQLVDFGPLYRVSPDGKTIVFIGMGGESERSKTARVWAYDLSSGVTRAITAADPFVQNAMWRGIEFSADSASVYGFAYEGDTRKIISVPLRGGSPHDLLSFPTNLKVIDLAAGRDDSLYLSFEITLTHAIDFSAKGGKTAQIVLAAPQLATPQRNGQVLLTSRVAGKSRLLIGRPGGAFKPVVESSEETSTPGAVVGDRVAFIVGTADARRIAVASLRDGRIQQRFAPAASEVQSVALARVAESLFYGAAGAIWEQRLGGGDPRRVTEGTDASLDPSGQFLFVHRSRSNGVALFRVPVGGGEEKELPASAGSRYAPVVFTPAASDGPRGALVTTLAPDSFYYRVAIADFEKNMLQPVPLAFDGDVYQPAYLEIGGIAALAQSYRDSIWHYTPKRR